MKKFPTFVTSDLATNLKTNTLVTTGDEFGTCGNLGKERNTK